MDVLEASTRVAVAPSELFAFLQDPSGWASYSDHVEEVRRYGDGGPGTDYRITVSWWRFSYTVHERVTDVDPPERIDWRTTDGVRATGSWRVESTESGSRLWLRIEVDPETLRGGTLARVLPFEELIARLRPVVAREAETILTGMVADLEGEPRPVEIELHQEPSFTVRASGR
ncbi:SRPBCC family protein [Halosegnis sp.]|uniref:SRPBCC family protein n=1 Tax=Halosegnis sp. TaxID=2864959 RepID=UPI0035D420F1